MIFGVCMEWVSCWSDMFVMLFLYMDMLTGGSASIASIMWSVVELCVMFTMDSMLWFSMFRV